MNPSDWKVLIVDDEPDNLSLIIDVMSFHETAVTRASSGQQAIALLDAQPFTMALVDLQMPLVSGWDVIKYVRESNKPELRHMLVIAITAYAMQGDRERVLKAGFNGYISKPIEIGTFVQTLQAIVEDFEAHTGQSITASAPNEEP